MYRIWNKTKQRWIENNKVLLNSNGDVIKFNLFCKDHIKILYQNKYVINFDIGIEDDKQVLLYEYDIVRVTLDNDSSNIICIITYVDELTAYVLIEFDDNKNKFYYFDNVSSIVKIGNVYENTELISNEELYNYFNTQKQYHTTEVI